MIKSAVEQVKEVKKLTEDTVNIPLTYLIFLSTCFLISNKKYISLINLSKWVPKNIQEIILGLFNILYSNIILIFIVLLASVLLLTLLSEYTPILNKLLPKEVEYMDDTAVNWNQYSAIRRLISIAYTLAMPCFVYYFTINVLLNQNHFVDNFFSEDKFQIGVGLISNSFFTDNTFVVMNSLFGINVVFTIYLILRALFEIRIPIDKTSLGADDLIFYTEINSFHESNNCSEQFETIILKKNYGKKVEYLLVHVKLTKEELETNRYNGKSEWRIVEVPYSKRRYRILNKADNLSDIIYHFDVLKDKFASDVAR